MQIAMPLFGKHNKNPAEVVKTLKDALNALDKVDRKAEKVSRRIRYAFSTYPLICFKPNFLP